MHLSVFSYKIRLMTELGITNWIRFGIWLLAGIVIYFFYSYSHSKLHRREAAAEA